MVMVKQNNRKTNVPRKARKGAYLVYSFRKAQSAYTSPLAMLTEALHLVNWKNTGEHIHELVKFQQSVKDKIREVRNGKKKRKRRKKLALTPTGEMYTAFQKWARKHGVPYSRTFYKEVWTPCWRAGVEPESNNEPQEERQLSSQPSEFTLSATSLKTHLQLDHEANKRVSQQIGSERYEKGWSDDN